VVNGRGDETSATSIVHVLLQAGACPVVIDNEGISLLAGLQRYRPTYTTTIALVEQMLAAAEITSLLVKTRRLIVAPSSSATPSYLHDRTTRGQPLPRVKRRRRVALQRNVKGGYYEKGEESCKLRATLGFVVGLEGGPEGEGMPRDVFRGVFMELLMPVWDPLRRGTGLRLQG